MGRDAGLIESLRRRAEEVRRATLLIHRDAQETRIASSLSAVEIFTVLYCGGLLSMDPRNPLWPERDRVIVSKGHGAISLYPILADLGFFDRRELGNVCREGTFLGGIPDSIIPGFETINGSLGHGLGVASGMALALKRRKRPEKVFVVMGDGELCEGSVWEAAMFASFHKLDNLMLIIDNNGACMLDFTRNVMDLEPLKDRFSAFGWHAMAVNGHDVEQLYRTVKDFKDGRFIGRPLAIAANTLKGKGVESLEKDPLSHVRNLRPQEVDSIIAGLA